MVTINRGFGKHIKQYQKKKWARVCLLSRKGRSPARCHLYVKRMLT